MPLSPEAQSALGKDHDLWPQDGGDLEKTESDLEHTQSFDAID